MVESRRRLGTRRAEHIMWYCSLASISCPLASISCPLASTSLSACKHFVVISPWQRRVLDRDAPIAHGSVFSDSRVGAPPLAQSCNGHAAALAGKSVSCVSAVWVPSSLHPMASRPSSPCTSTTREQLCSHQSRRVTRQAGLALTSYFSGGGVGALSGSVPRATQAVLISADACTCMPPYHRTPGRSAGVSAHQELSTRVLLAVGTWACDVHVHYGPCGARVRDRLVHGRWRLMRDR